MARGQLWRCQKHPLTNNALARPGNTRSGVPGRSLRCNRYRSPSACAAFRTASSGPVFFEFTRDIVHERIEVGASARGKAFFHFMACNLAGRQPERQRQQGEAVLRPRAPELECGRGFFGLISEITSPAGLGRAYNLLFRGRLARAKDMVESEGPIVDFCPEGSSTSSLRRRTIWPITGGSGAGSGLANKADGLHSR